MLNRLKQLIGRGRAGDADPDSRLEEFADVARRTRLIVDTAYEGFISIDETGRIVDWNPQAEAIFGWSREEALGRELATTIVPEHYREAHRAGLQRYIASGEEHVLGQRLELAGIRRDGSEFPVELTIATVKTRSGNIFHAFLRDITERKQAQAEADRLKDEFFALVSHELSTPLTSIVGYLEILRQDTEASGMSGDQVQALDVLDRNARRLRRLVGDLLFVAQIARGKLALEMGDVDLAAVVNHSVEGARPMAGEQQVELLLENELPASCRGDAVRLGQAIDNLISNAIKFTQPGGRVTVRMRDLDGPVRVEVSDTGIGIPEEEQAQLFDRFFRASNAVEQSVPGIGLGLTIVQAIAEGHGGQVGLASEQGKGTTMWVELPTAADVGAAQDDQTPVAEPAAEPAA